MIEGIVTKYLAVEGHTEVMIAKHLSAPGVASFTCGTCNETCSVSDQMTFIDWDLNESTVCNVCHWKLTYHKIAMRRARPYYFRKKERARALGVPFD